MEPSLWIDETPIHHDEILNQIRKRGEMPKLIKDFILDNALKEIRLEEDFNKELIYDYRQTNGLQDQGAFNKHLIERHINEKLLLNIISRPHRIVRYREERWGAFAQSLYLQNKEQYDSVFYKRLQAQDSNVMQEIYFRIKDGEETWDSMARQFPNAKPDTTALRGPIAVSQIEESILIELRKNKTGQISKPIQVGEEVAVISLVRFQPSCFDEELRTQLLREAFDKWLEGECARVGDKIRFENDTGQFVDG